MTDLLDPATVDYDRDRWGRPLIVPAGGGKPKPYTRSSTAAKTVEDTYNLELWARRNVVYGMAHDASLVARVLALGGTPYTWGDDAKKAVNKIHERAAEVALAHKGADIGTAVHTMTERVDRGEQFDAGIYEADITAYVSALIRAELYVDPAHIECRLVCDELEMAGTADRILAHADGRRLIADIKTGASVDYGGLGWAAQLASYAHGTLYDVAKGERVDTPPLDRTTGIIIHIPAGQGVCTLYEIDLVAGFRAAQLANEIRSVRQASRRWITPLAGLSAGTVDTRLNTPGSLGAPAPGGSGSAPTVPAQAPVVPEERRNVFPLPGVTGRRTRLLERYRNLHPARAAAFRARGIDRDDLDAIEAALDELTQPRLADAAALQAQEVTDLAVRLMTISPEDRAVLDAVAREAFDGPGPISYRFEPHQRNLHVCRALVGMCQWGWDESVLRGLIACAIGDTVAEALSIPLAETLAQMSTEEAATLDGLVAALGD
jgi:hypothetical protein